MPATRIYLILDRATGNALRGVRAATQPSALAHYSADALAVVLPTQDQLIAAIRAGVPIDEPPADKAAEAAQAGARG